MVALRAPNHAFERQESAISGRTNWEVERRDKAESGHCDLKFACSKPVIDYQRTWGSAYARLNLKFLKLALRGRRQLDVGVCKERACIEQFLWTSGTSIATWRPATAISTSITSVKN